MLSSITVMDSVNYILTAVICSCEGLDAHAHKERGNILPQKASRWLAPESSAIRSLTTTSFWEIIESAEASASAIRLPVNRD